MNSVDLFFQQSHYNIIRVLLSISGLWPYHTTSKRRAIYFGFLLVFGSGLTFEVLGMIEVWPDSYEVVDCLPLLVLGAVSMIKLVCAVYTLPEITILLTKMQDYCLSLKSNEETNILHSYALYGRNLGYAYMGILFSHTVVFVFATLLTKLLDTGSSNNNSSSITHETQVGLFYHVNYIVDVETYYVPIFIHSATCVVFYTLLMITFDVLYLTLVQHCCGLFQALRYRLEYATKLENENGDLILVSGQDKIHSNILYSIRRHAEAIKFVTIMEAIYRIPLFVHVGANISILSILGFQVITNTENINRVLKYASYLSALLVNTFFENWQGQKIIDSSEKVFESAYNAEWYKMSPEQRKFLIMIMMKSKKPLQIIAGNLVALSYVNFNAVIRTSSSYFMLLRSIQ
ncbi:odorant receptor 67a-like isoform X2 [Harpegnathos saltator]|uniref:odorant receptor 67a-like isoform X2 n=1 Tax=Harpegnathos saltator TaxID=610380 RepID=UPI000948D78D|nr:odorant receptor 67a-like isoform X2 [Harpegnathos saltator]